eukprot:c8477_g1_i1.p1 GENE.c8477_g1_i1~~c8477_g1_i1.p1  ORF type:complete len:212 (+),score=43.95 c8477_g1_i1:203-838(+)
MTLGRQSGRKSSAGEGVTKVIKVIPHSPEELQKMKAVATSTKKPRSRASTPKTKTTNHQTRGKRGQKKEEPTAEPEPSTPVADVEMTDDKDGLKWNFDMVDWFGSKSPAVSQGWKIHKSAQLRPSTTPNEILESLLKASLNSFSKTPTTKTMLCFPQLVSTYTKEITVDEIPSATPTLSASPPSKVDELPSEAEILQSAAWSLCLMRRVSC